MPKEFPTPPDWNALGFPPKPEPRYESRFYDYPLPPETEYLDEVNAWVSNLPPTQRKMYNDYQEQMRAGKRQVREELEAIKAQEYEKYGLEMGVNSEHELMVARNMAGLLDGIERVRLAIGGQEANEQFEGFFHSR
ncbi:MAG: hypothetical protein AAB481_04770 [Patescibacteria group bacterium]